MLRPTFIFALIFAAATAAANAAPATASQAVTCDKDKCVCVGPSTDCLTALTNEKRCKAPPVCTRPVEGTVDANNKWNCACGTKPKA